jgi:hypothetical protein
MKPLRSRGAEVDSTTAAGVCDGSSDTWPWEALSILALMFTGTMLYRAEQGKYPS